MSYIKSQRQPLRAVLVTNFLIAELLSSRVNENYLLWLVSPWVTDFSLNLPVGGNLASLLDSTEMQPRLFELLRQIAVNGGQVRLVVRPEYKPKRVKRFIQPLLTLAANEPNIVVRQLPKLHTKLYAGQHGILHGSLNLTESVLSVIWNLAPIFPTRAISLVCEPKRNHSLMQPRS